MNKYRMKIPSVGLLVTFEAAARHQSFTAAADELYVTQAAVSRQIKNLETFLGVRLFNRRNRSVSLTHAGAHYLSAVGACLDRLADVTRDFERRSAPAPLTVGTTAAFSTFWLIPRISGFRQKHPEIDLRFAIDDRLLALGPAGIDLSIRFGDGTWPNLRQQYLFPSDIEPLCSPRYWQGRPKISNYADLLNESLLDLDIPIDVSWRTWFRRHGVIVPEDFKRLEIDQYPGLVQAVLNGQGMALLGAPLVDDLRDNGTLINPTIGSPESFPGAYYLVSSLNAPTRAEQSLFEEWLLEEAARTQLAVSPSRPASAEPPQS